MENGRPIVFDGPPREGGGPPITRWSPVAAEDLGPLGGAGGAPRLEADRVRDEPDAPVAQGDVHPVRVTAAGQLHPRPGAGRGGGARRVAAGVVVAPGPREHVLIGQAVG